MRCLTKCKNKIIYPSKEKTKYLLGYDVMWSGRNLPTFRCSILLPSSGSKSKPNKQQTCCLVLYLDSENRSSTCLRNVGKLLTTLYGLTPQMIIQNVSSQSGCLWGAYLCFSELITSIFIAKASTAEVGGHFVQHFIGTSKVMFPITRT